MVCPYPSRSQEIQHLSISKTLIFVSACFSYQFHQVPSGAGPKKIQPSTHLSNGENTPLEDYMKS